ncbi:cobyric acid synthase CobQ [Bradyrhizobium sp. GM6.1]
MARALMIQGAGSDVGKSLIVAGLARAFVRRGLRVVPFKPQNMSNNAAVTVDGGEIGRAQALQALAAGVEPHTDMNPVLLKPETDVGAQVIVQGKRIATARAREYAAMKPSLMGAVLESFERLKARADLVLVEGAGSPAEVNLRKADIANMGFARKADVPVVLVGDINRGGVIAQLVGIKTVIDPDDAAMIQGFVINKFRGDPTLFDDGYRLIEEKTAWRGLGVLPWFARAGELPAEDALGLSDARKPGQCKIACLALSRIANFDDLDPLKLEPGVDLVMVRPGARPFPATCASSSFPARNPPVATSPFCARRAGTSISWRITAEAAMCSASAAAIRCSDAASLIPRGSRAPPATHRVSDFWMWKR